jgi:hypothetical protein
MINQQSFENQRGTRVVGLQPVIFLRHCWLAVNNLSHERGTLGLEGLINLEIVLSLTWL